MQTFLAYANLKKSIIILDDKRLGKQRVEAKQVLDIVAGLKPDSGWRHHPTVKMWMGYPETLGYYMNLAIGEWILRGFKNTMKKVDVDSAAVIANKPPWLGDERVHSSHRGRLLHKNPEYYGRYGWKEEPIPPEEGYFWPV